MQPTSITVGSKEPHLSPASPSLNSSTTLLVGMPSDRSRYNGQNRDRYRDDNHDRRGRHHDPTPYPSPHCKCRDPDLLHIHTRQLRVCRERPNGPGYWSAFHDMLWTEYPHLPETEDGAALRAMSTDTVCAILLRVIKEGEQASLKRCLEARAEDHYRKMKDLWEPSTQDYTKHSGLVPWNRNTANDYRTWVNGSNSLNHRAPTLASEDEDFYRSLRESREGHETPRDGPTIPTPDSAEDTSTSATTVSTASEATTETKTAKRRARATSASSKGTASDSSNGGRRKGNNKKKKKAPPSIAEHNAPQDLQTTEVTAATEAKTSALEEKVADLERQLQLIIHQRLPQEQAAAQPAPHQPFQPPKEASWKCDEDYSRKPSTPLPTAPEAPSSLTLTSSPVKADYPGSAASSSDEVPSEPEAEHRTVTDIGHPVRQGAGQEEAANFQLKEETLWRCKKCHHEQTPPPPGSWEACEHCGGETELLTTADFISRHSVPVDPVADDQNKEATITDEKQKEAPAQAANDLTKAKETTARATQELPTVPAPGTPVPKQPHQAETRVPAPGTPATIATAASCSPPRVPAPGTPARISTAAPLSPTFRAAQLVPGVAGPTPQPEQEHTQKSKRKSKVFSKSQTPPFTLPPKEKPEDCASSSSDKVAKKKKSKKQAR